jgi:hypothetical protein
LFGASVTVISGGVPRGSPTDKAELFTDALHRLVFRQHVGDNTGDTLRPRNVDQFSQ